MTKRAATTGKPPVVASPKDDDSQTWIVYTDADGKTHRVKSEDYKEQS